MSKQSDELGDEATDLMMAYTLQPNKTRALAQLCIKVVRLSKENEKLKQQIEAMTDGHQTRSTN